MIYLIGGPPKCGKTTLAKQLAKKLGIQWVATDTLEVIGREYIGRYTTKKEFARLYPHSAMKGKNNDETYARETTQQIMKNLIAQARPTEGAIDMFSICEITDGNDYIIEGYHVTPALAARLMKKYGRKNFRVLFIVKRDVEKFVVDVKKSSTPNDWVIGGTKKQETFFKIGDMISRYGRWFEKEAGKYKFAVVNMDEDFEGKIKEAVRCITGG